MRRDTAAAEEDEAKKSRREEVAVLLLPLVVDAEFMARLKAKTDPQVNAAAVPSMRPNVGKRMPMLFFNSTILLSAGG